MAKGEMTYTLDEMKDRFVGKPGTAERDQYEYALRMAILGKMIRAIRKERKLTQEELGELIGVQKAQISKLESSANSATIDTILKVFSALKAEISFQVRLDGSVMTLGGKAEGNVKPPRQQSRKVPARKTISRASSK